VWEDLVELAVRYEWFDDNSDIEDHGDQQLIVGGYPRRMRDAAAVEAARAVLGQKEAETVAAK